MPVIPGGIRPGLTTRKAPFSVDGDVVSVPRMRNGDIDETGVIFAVFGLEGF